MIKIYVQIKCKKKNIPNKDNIKKWIRNTIASNNKNYIITIIIVSRKEMIALNKKYKNKNKITNILSFNLGKQTNKYYNAYIGELVICKKKVEEEAKKNNLLLISRWAHLIIHGTLHLLNYTHENKKNFKKMNKIEKKKMNIFGFLKEYNKNQYIK